MTAWYVSYKFIYKENLLIDGFFFLQIYSPYKAQCCKSNDLKISTIIVSDETGGNVPCPSCYSNGYFPGTQNNTYYQCQYDSNGKVFNQTIYTCKGDTIYDSKNHNCSATTRPSIATVSNIYFIIFHMQIINSNNF